jgi:hypothetical protein
VKRLLQLVSAVLALLAVALGWRLTQALSVAPPEFADPPALSISEPLPSAPRGPSGGKAVIDGIVGGNLFETERGYVDVEDEADGAVSEEPLPPPTNVLLNGVFFRPSGRPMVIMTDSSAGNKQLTLGIGDNVGDYQVGSITDTRVTLLGRGGQQFSVDLDIKKGGGAPARPAPRAAAARNTPGNNAANQTPAQRAAQARAAAQRAAQQRAQQARQKAANAKPGAKAGAGAPAAAAQKNDATQARLEALKRLREAAASR